MWQLFVSVQKRIPTKLYRLPYKRGLSKAKYRFSQK